MEVAWEDRREEEEEEVVEAGPVVVLGLSPIILMLGRRRNVQGRVDQVKECRGDRI